MKQSIKAALLSGLVFPGTGYFAIKRPLRGLIACVLAAASLVHLISVAMTQASLLIDKVMSGEVPLNVGSVGNLVTQTADASSTATSNLASFVLLACWLISTLDGFRIGQKQDQEKLAGGQPPVPSPRVVSSPAGPVQASMIPAADAGMPVVRTARRDELPQLLQLYRHLHASDAELPAAEIVEGVWLSMLANPAMRILVAVTGEAGQQQLVASATLLIIPNLTRGARSYALIENVVTDRAWRRRGVGTQILKAAQQMAWGANCYKVMLMTGSKKEEILRFYRNAGFVDGDKTGFVARPG